MLKVVDSGAGREASEQLFELDEIARMGARRMPMAALKTEADDYVERHRVERNEMRRALVVHNGRSQERKLTLGTGTVGLRAPRVNDSRRDEHGQRQRFLLDMAAASLAAPRWRSAIAAGSCRCEVRGWVRHDRPKNYTDSSDHQPREAA